MLEKFGVYEEVIQEEKPSGDYCHIECDTIKQIDLDSLKTFISKGAGNLPLYISTPNKRYGYVGDILLTRRVLIKLSFCGYKTLLVNQKGMESEIDLTDIETLARYII